MIASCLSSLGQLFLFRVGLGACGGVVIYLFGAETVAYEVVFFLAMLDVATGLLKAKRNGTINSTKFFAKLPMLIGYIILLMAAHQLTRLVPELAVLQGWCAAFIGLGELISIIENLGEVGVVVPSSALKLLKKIKSEKNKSK